MQTTHVAIIEDKDKTGKYLFLQRGKGQLDGIVWAFPGGKEELGETPKQALEREVLEETGIICEVVEKIGERDDRPLHYHRAHYISGVPRDAEDGETSQVAFRTVAEILTLVPLERIHASVQRELGIV